MAYDVTLFDGTTHTINGEGTVDDPWLIDCFEGLMKHVSGENYAYKYITQGYYKFADEIISIEQELPVAGDTAEDIARKKKTIDMNRIAPTNAFEATDIVNTDQFFKMKNDTYIDGNGCIIKNLYLEMNISTNGSSGAMFLIEATSGHDSELKNLNFENAYINPLSKSQTLSIIRISGYGSYIKNCKFSVMTNTDDSYENYGLYIKNIAVSKTSVVSGCSFNFRNICGHMYPLYYNGSGSFTYSISNNVFRCYAPYLPTYVNSISESRNTGIIGGGCGGNNVSNSLTLLNCKFIYETLNKGNHIFLRIINFKEGSNAHRLYIKNCVFEVINKKKDTYPISDVNKTSGSSCNFTESGVNLYIWDEGSNTIPTMQIIPNPITKAQSIDKDYLLDLLFPLMWEDE